MSFELFCFAIYRIENDCLNTEYLHTIPYVRWSYVVSKNELKFKININYYQSMVCVNCIKR